MNELPNEVLYKIAEKLEWTLLPHFLMLSRRCREASSGVALRRKRQLIRILRNWSIRTLPRCQLSSRSTSSKSFPQTRQQCLDMMTRSKRYEEFCKYLWCAFVPSLSSRSRAPVGLQLSLRASRVLRRQMPCVYEAFTSITRDEFLDSIRCLSEECMQDLVRVALEAMSALHLVQLQFACALAVEGIVTNSLFELGYDSHFYIPIHLLCSLRNELGHCCKTLDSIITI